MLGESLLNIKKKTIIKIFKCTTTTIVLYKKCHTGMKQGSVIITYLKNIISDIMNLDNRWISFTKFWAQHLLESWWSIYQYDLVSIKYSTLHPELDIRKLRVVYKFGINSCSSWDCGITNFFYSFFAVTGAKYVS